MFGARIAWVDARDGERPDLERAKRMSVMTDVRFFGLVMMLMGGVLAGYGVLDYVLSAGDVGVQESAINAVTRIVGGATIFIVGAGAVDMARDAMNRDPEETVELLDQPLF